MAASIQFDPTSLSKYGRLVLVARNLVEGFLTGVHKSPYKGFSVEFAEHRQYYPGDEIRHIDWRAYGKTDRYYIKEYEEETNLKAYLLVDASGSMAYRGRTQSKFDYARLLDATHQAELAQKVNYAALAGSAQQSAHDLDQPHLPLDPDGQVQS